MSVNLLPQRQCVECNTTFIPRRASTKCCSWACAQAVSRVALHLRRQQQQQAPPESKICPTCNTEKPIAAFVAHSRHRNRWHRHCRDCEIADPGRFTARDSLIQKVRKFGITVDEYHWLLTQQEGRCAICRADDRKLAIDHSHSTGEIRGLLCGRCNSMLGFLNDSTESLQNAITYLGDYQVRLAPLLRRIQTSPSRFPARPCVSCKRDFFPRRTAQQLYCTRSCLRRSQYVSRQARFANPRTCPHCLRVFTPKLDREKMVYCSQRCSRDARKRVGCEVQRCTEPHHSHGYCGRHYAQYCRTGSPTVYVRGPYRKQQKESA